MPYIPRIIILFCAFTCIFACKKDEIEDPPSIFPITLIYHSNDVSETTVYDTSGIRSEYPESIPGSGMGSSFMDSMVLTSPTVAIEYKDGVYDTVRNVMQLSFAEDSFIVVRKELPDSIVDLDLPPVLLPDTASIGETRFPKYERQYTTNTEKITAHYTYCFIKNDNSYILEAYHLTFFFSGVDPFYGMISQRPRINEIDIQQQINNLNDDMVLAIQRYQEIYTTK